MTIKQLLKERLETLGVSLITIFTAPAFVQAFAAAVLIFLSGRNLISIDLANTIAGLLGISIVKGTVDKFAQAKIASATNTTVSMPSQVSTVTATTSKSKQAVN